MPGAGATEPEEVKKRLGSAMARELTGRSTHPWVLPTISISVLFLVPVDASSENCRRSACGDPNDQPQCIDSQSNRLVKREMCSTGCCVYKSNELSRLREFPAKRLPHCGTQKECELQNSKNRPKKEDESSWKELLYSILGLNVVTVGLLAAKSRRNQHVEKKRDSELHKILDDNLPAMMYDDLHDPEQQLDQDEFCCICLDVLKGSMVRQLHCRHVLHQYCFDRWCLDSSERRRKNGLICTKSEWSSWTCPLCRNSAVLLENSS